MAQNGTVIPQGLNLRETPGGTVIRVLPQGASVEILEDQGDVLKVDANGQVGFVAARFIQRGASGGGASGAGVSGAGVSGAGASAGGSFHFEGNKAVAPDGAVFGKKFQMGIFNVGNTSI